MTDQNPRPGPGRQRATPSSPPPPYPPRQEPADAHERPGHGHLLDGSPHGGHGGHRLMMIACCIPMLLIVGVLVATGAAGTGVIVYAAVCLGMMALMMFAMRGGHRH